MGYYIHGKVVEQVMLWNPKEHKPTPCGPHATFKALSANGVRVSQLKDAKLYETREAAQKKIDEAIENQKKVGYEGRIVFEIRKAK